MLASVVATLSPYIMSSLSGAWASRAQSTVTVVRRQGFDAVPSFGLARLGRCYEYEINLSTESI